MSTRKLIFKVSIITLIGLFSAQKLIGQDYKSILINNLKDCSIVELSDSNVDIDIYNYFYHSNKSLISFEEKAWVQPKYNLSIITLPNYEEKKIKWEKISMQEMPKDILKIYHLDTNLISNFQNRSCDHKFKLYKKEKGKIYKCNSRILIKYFELSEEFVLFPTENKYHKIHFRSNPFSITDYNKIVREVLIPNKVIGNYYNLERKINISGKQYFKYNKNKVFDCWMLPNECVDGPNDLDLYHFIYFEKLGVINIEKNSLFGLNIDDTAFEFFKVLKINGKKANHILEKYLK